VGQVRDTTAAALGDAWNHARFEAARTRIEQQLGGGRLREAFDGAQQLLERGRAAGEQAYPGADYDLAGACWLLARVLDAAHSLEQALPLVDEACQRFQAIANEHPGIGAERMMAVCFADQGGSLRGLGRLDEAAAAYEESIRRAEQLGDTRQVAVAKGQLGTVLMLQRRYEEALAA
jgi:tetratricopeptide (TPR) repeat protein